VEKYRPRRACEVLGNEVEAIYLRDWLSALTVGSKEEQLPKVIRKIKKYKPQAIDGWIVDDLGLFGGPLGEEDDEDEQDFIEIEEPPLPFSTRPNHYPPFKERLANTILLCGPSGSGKSAAVYAAATELGWDVFEVYPGIGKRTGTNLMSLVGDVGKNHMVLQSKDQATPKKRGFFDALNMRPSPKARAMGSQEKPIELGDTPNDDSPVEEVSHGDDSRFRQSLIFLDEVDLLFDEENTFWVTVRALIAESRRPVILTCNGERYTTA